MKDPDLFVNVAPRNRTAPGSRRRLLVVASLALAATGLIASCTGSEDVVAGSSALPPAAASEEPLLRNLLDHSIVRKLPGEADMTGASIAAY